MTLKSAGWNRVPGQIGPLDVNALGEGGETASQAFDTGVSAFVSPDNEGAIPAVLALAAALTAEGIPCEPYKTDQLIGKTPKAIVINIGKKP